MLNQTKKFVYESVIPVRWYDMDAFNHVNTSVYFTYYEQTRINWLMEIAPADYTLEKTGPVVVNATCTYLKPIVYPEIITVKLYVGAPGRSSFETFYEIHSQKNSATLYAEGYVKMVWIDRKTGHSVPIPDELRKFLIETDSQ